MSHKALQCPSWALQNHSVLQLNASEEQMLQASGQLKMRLAPFLP